MPTQQHAHRLAAALTRADAAVHLREACRLRADVFGHRAGRRRHRGRGGGHASVAARGGGLEELEEERVGGRATGRKRREGVQVFHQDVEELGPAFGLVDAAQERRHVGLSDGLEDLRDGC